MTVQSSNPTPSCFAGDNLLKNKWIDRFLRSRWYPGAFQIPIVLMLRWLIEPPAAVIAWR